MRRIVFLALASVVGGCSAPEAPDQDSNESVGESRQDLNGALSNAGFLVGGRLSQTTKNLAESDETARQENTDAYYDNVGSNASGNGASIRDGLGTLEQFQNQFGFGSFGITTSYYNRGDLGLGREMHCSDRMASSQQSIACYVTNYASGPAGSEFTFGFSPQIAFANMDAGKVVATVAMVYRKKANTNKVIFIVYDAEGKITNSAPLDRHGISFDETRPETGTPGVNFNNHIPSNCLNCHGGSYSPDSFQVSEALFLPFDLDQFDYRDSASRAALEPTFATMNQLVRTVAANVKNAEHPVVTQIDKWYEAGNGVFNGEAVPTGWAAPEDAAVFKSVVRKSCRGCHMTSAFSFDSAEAFIASRTDIRDDIVSHAMPHALQTQRLFWQSGQPAMLANWFKDKNFPDIAEDIAAAGPTNLVTLDPHLIQASF
jgi:hypothetical protein